MNSTLSSTIVRNLSVRWYNLGFEKLASISGFILLFFMLLAVVAYKDDGKLSSV